ncbi:MAG: hypothetical protein A3E38_03110 [Candidatus Moranbacteria bacterium RIFCSPHIGHO2_12_FULL_54_9]|nr:MAG: hypothetical protein A2878_01495 [Candidatus Moranbacteria bacterium RIFCSPHIGHO2_01_FULL_54_31]OGI25942.1 MAG: hypothetical protein A3E38_03110 [Candidatus Moranbacteria bacterium RIFCSPHIGHO2_12_FULL_54_9]
MNPSTFESSAYLILGIIALVTFAFLLGLPPRADQSKDFYQYLLGGAFGCGILFVIWGCIIFPQPRA